MFDYYQFPLYAFSDDKTLLLIGFHLFKPKWTPPIAKSFPGSTAGDKNTPWVKRTQARAVDAEGYVHLTYDIPGMGVQYDWDWIKQHDVRAEANTPVSGRPATKGGELHNKEAKAMQEMLRPFLDADYKATEDFGKDKGNPSLQYIRETNRKIAEALPEKLSTPVAAKRRILVLTCKTMGPLHVPGAAGLITLLRQAEKKYGAFELTELYTTESIDVKLLSGFDAVVLNNISQSWGNTEDKLYNQLLPAYVKNGGGLFAIHGSALLFMDKPQAEYNNMLGGFVMKSPELNYMVHPKKIGNWNHGSSFAVKILEPSSPLAAAFRETPAKYTLNLCWGRMNGQ